jgi:hypothetical protein
MYRFKSHLAGYGVRYLSIFSESAEIGGNNERNNAALHKAEIAVASHKPAEIE